MKTTLTVACVMTALCAVGEVQKPTAKKTILSESELRTLAKADPDVKNAGMLYLAARATSNNVERKQAYIKAAEQGHVEAQFELGVYYNEDEGGEHDKKEAVKWFRKAAEQGNAKAQFNLGLFYNKGEGVPQDKNEALKWFRKAAENGLPQAQFNLGQHYHRG